MGTYEVLEVVEPDLPPRGIVVPRILWAALGAALITYWAVTVDHQEILDEGYKLMERLVSGPPERASKKKKLQALQRLKKMEEAGQFDPRIPDSARELALRVTSLELPEFIEGVRVGTPSAVPGVPPVGAVLPIGEVLPREQWLGGRRLTMDPETMMVPLGDRELASPEDLTQFPIIMHEILDDFRAMAIEDGSLAIEFEEWVQDQYQVDVSDPEFDMTEAYADFEEFLSGKIEELLHEFMWRNESETYSKDRNYTWEIFATTEMDRYATTHVTTAITNEKTARTYSLHGLYDLFYKALKDPFITFTEDDMDYATMYLWDATPDETRIDREIKRALSQYLSKSLLPGQYAGIHRSWWMGESGCEAYECYKPPRTIMDPNLQIMKSEGETSEVEECPADPYGYSYYQDYCWQFAKTLQLAVESEMGGVTWGGSPWFVDICGVHVEVGDQYYTIPADNMLEYMMGQYNVPRYLEGLVCAAFAVVTPEMQKEMEVEVTGGELMAKAEIANKEMPLIIDVIGENILWNLGSPGQVRYVEVYERDGWIGALRWLNSSDSEIPTTGTYGDDIEWSVDDDGHFHMDWAQGKTIGRGKYIVANKYFARYLLDIAKGRSRRTIHYESA